MKIEIGNTKRCIFKVHKRRRSKVAHHFNLNIALGKLMWSISCSRSSAKRGIEQSFLIKQSIAETLRRDKKMEKVPYKIFIKCVDSYSTNEPLPWLAFWLSSEHAQLLSRLTTKQQSKQTWSKNRNVIPITYVF